MAEMNQKVTNLGKERGGREVGFPAREGPEGNQQSQSLFSEKRRKKGKERRDRENRSQKKNGGEKSIAGREALNEKGGKEEIAISK